MCIHMCACVALLIAYLLTISHMSLTPPSFSFNQRVMTARMKRNAHLLNAESISMMLSDVVRKVIELMNLSDNIAEACAYLYAMITYGVTACHICKYPDLSLAMYAAARVERTKLNELMDSVNCAQADDACCQRIISVCMTVSATLEFAMNTIASTDLNLFNASSMTVQFLASAHFGLCAGDHVRATYDACVAELTAGGSVLSQDLVTKFETMMSNMANARAVVAPTDACV